MIGIDTSICNSQSTQMVTPMQTTALLFHKLHAEVAVTHHIVHEGIIGAGQVVNAQGVQSLLRDLLPERQEGHILPANVLVNTRDMLVWYKPAFIKTMWFTDPVRGYTVRWPNLLFVLNKQGGLKVFCTATGARPDNSTRIYHAPLMNLSDTGNLCFGSAPRPPGSRVEDIEGWENALINSKFSHLNGRMMTYVPASRTKSIYTDKAAHKQFWRDKGTRRLYAKELVYIDRLGNLVAQAGGEQS